MHPDKRAQGEEDSPEFHLLKRAHDTLSDDYKRQVYDRFGEDGLEFVEAVKKNPQAGAMTERSYTLDQVRLDELLPSTSIFPLAAISLSSPILTYRFLDNSCTTRSRNSIINRSSSGSARM